MAGSSAGRMISSPILQMRSCLNHAKVADYKAFCEAEAGWLDDYALFMCLKDYHSGRSWLEWPDPYRLRDFSALAAFQADHEIEISRQKVYQFWFLNSGRASKRMPMNTKSPSWAICDFYLHG